jgi:hypothetical protein
MMAGKWYWHWNQRQIPVGWMPWLTARRYPAELPVGGAFAGKISSKTLSPTLIGCCAMTGNSSHNNEPLWY